MDTSVSPHEQAQLDKVSSDEYRKLEVSLKGKSPEEQDRLRADHRARFTEANKGGFIENLLNKPNPRLQGYNQATNTSLKYGTIDALAQLQKGFTEEHDETYRTNALIAMYDSQNAKAEGMSAEVAQQWRADSEAMFEANYMKVRNDADAIQKAEGVATVINATDNELTHMGDFDLIEGNNSLEGFKKLDSQANPMNEDGTRGFNLELGQKVYTSIQKMRKMVKEQNPQMTADELNVLVGEKYKWASETYNSPQMFEYLMSQKNGSGRTGAELNPKYNMETQLALNSATAKKRDMLTNKDHEDAVAESTALFQQQELHFADLSANALEGDREAKVALGVAVETAQNFIRNNPNIRHEDAMKLMRSAQTLEREHRTFIKSELTATHTQGLQKAMADMGSITDFDRLINIYYPEAEPKQITYAKAMWSKQVAENEGKSADQRANLASLKSNVRRSVPKAFANSVRDMYQSMASSTDEGKALDPNIVLPNINQAVMEYESAWDTFLYNSSAVTDVEYNQAKIDFTDQYFEVYMDNIRVELGTVLSKAGSDTAFTKAQDAIKQSTAEFTNTPSAGTLGARPQAEPEAEQVEAKPLEGRQIYNDLTPEQFVQEYPKYLASKVDPASNNVYEVIDVALDDLLANAPHQLEDPEQAVTKVVEVSMQLMADRYDTLDPRAQQLFDEIAPMGLNKWVSGGAKLSSSEVKEILLGSVVRGSKYQAYDDKNIPQSYEALKAKLEEIGYK